MHAPRCGRPFTRGTAAIIARVDRLRFEDAIADVENDYRSNGKKTLEALQRRVKKHLKPYFGGRRLVAITTSEVREYTSKRLDAGAKPATINRELAILKRAFTLAVQAGKQHSKLPADAYVFGNETGELLTR